MVQYPSWGVYAVREQYRSFIILHIGLVRLHKTKHIIKVTNKSNVNNKSIILNEPKISQFNSKGNIQLILGSVVSDKVANWVVVSNQDQNQAIALNQINHTGIDQTSRIRPYWHCLFLLDPILGSKKAKDPVNSFAPLHLWFSISICNGKKKVRKKYLRPFVQGKLICPSSIFTIYMEALLEGIINK